MSIKSRMRDNRYLPVYDEDDEWVENIERPYLSRLYLSLMGELRASYNQLIEFLFARSARRHMRFMRSYLETVPVGRLKDQHGRTYLAIESKSVAAKLGRERIIWFTNIENQTYGIIAIHSYTATD